MSRTYSDEQLLRSDPATWRPAFLALASREDVADLIETPLPLLNFVLHGLKDEERYREFEIPKANGKSRLIQAPLPPLLFIQARLHQVLTAVYRPKPSVHGFVADRGIATNARRHAHKRFVLNLDLADFFPTIHFGRVQGMFAGRPYFLPQPVATMLAQICCYRRCLPQGAPTSPVVSNMLCGRLDSELQEFANRYDCHYTRYADDITFSTSRRTFPAEVASGWEQAVVLGDGLRQIIEANGFTLNDSKQRLQPAWRHQEVTGLTVNEAPNVRRAYVRQVRAMLHAWDVYGIEDAEREHRRRWRGQSALPRREGEESGFKEVVRGKLAFLQSVRSGPGTPHAGLVLKFQALERRDRAQRRGRIRRKADDGN